MKHETTPDDTGIEPEPCRYCGKETAQRVAGIPYCSMDHIEARRRELRLETLQCPYPDCGWEIEYDPGGAFSRMKADHEIEKHRRDHVGR